jgi:hypothetical protein
MRGRIAYEILMGKPEGKRPLERPRRMCDDNIEVDLKWDWVAWTGFV